MKIKRYIAQVFLMIVLSTHSYAALQEVRDTTNLIQNIQHTLRTIHIESATMTQIAQKAKSLGNEVTMIMNLCNQLKLAEQNIQNVVALVQSGKYRSIKELNNMCYAVQRVGHNVDGIGQTFKQLFPETYALYKTEKARQTQKMEQKRFIEQAARTALNIQDYTMDDEENQRVTTDIETIVRRSKDVVGIKGAIQLQNELIAILIQENRKLNQIVATSEQVKSLESAERVGDERRKKEEHERFMKDWGKAKTPKTVLKEFP